MHNNTNKPRRPNNAAGGNGQHRHYNNNNNNRPRRFNNNRQEGGGDAASVTRTRRNATQNREKYQMMAQSAQSSGDRVLTEYYLQHADHYHRVLLGLPPEEPPRPQYLRGHAPHEQAQQGAAEPAGQGAPVSTESQETSGQGASAPVQNDHARDGYSRNVYPQNGHAQNGQHEHHAPSDSRREAPVPAQHDLPPFLMQPPGAEGEP